MEGGASFGAMTGKITSLPIGVDYGSPSDDEYGTITVGYSEKLINPHQVRILVKDKWQVEDS